MAQSKAVARRLADAHPGLDVEFVEVASGGDIDQVSPVTTLTEVGAFVRAVQKAVLDDDADIAVHSCKDLPVSGPEELVAFYPEREEPWDVLCGAELDDLEAGAVVGTGSPRRAAQLRLLRPDVEVSSIRGNVGTRLSQIDRGDYDAIVLASAGLTRLGLRSAITQVFDIGEMVPAPAQAALAVEARRGSDAALLLEDIDEPGCRSQVEAERWLLALTGAGCRSALGALATANSREVSMTAFVEDARGSRRATVSATDSLGAATLMQEKLGL